MSRSSSGQATTEYIGLLALLVAVVAAALGVAVAGAPGVVNAVVGQVRHALCLVAGGECHPSEPRACVMRSDGTTRGFTVAIVVVRLDHERSLLRERLSDGTQRLTVFRRAGAGFSVSTPTGAEIQLGGTRFAVGGEAAVQLLAIGGRGRVWHAAAAEADRIAAALEGDGEDPEPHEVYLEGGLSATAQLDAVLGLDGSGDGTGSETGGRAAAPGSSEADGERVEVPFPEAGARQEAELVVGRREDRRTGERSFYLRLDERAQVVVEAGVAGLQGAGGAGGLAEVRVERDGRPRELVVSGSLMARGEAAGPGLDAVGLGAVRGSRRVEVTSRLDLRVPENARAFAAWRAAPLDVRTAETLARAVARAGRVELRAYATAGREDSSGVSARLGLEVGGEWREGEEHERLVGASDRPPGGLWEPRLDCAAAA